MKARLKRWLHAFLPLWALVQRVARIIYGVPYLHGVLRTTGRTLGGFYRDDCHIMSAAISFYSILSLIPFTLLLFSVAGYILNAMGQSFANEEELFAHLQTYIKAVLPFLSGDIMDRLHGVIINRQAYGITGVVILLATAGLVFRTLEVAFAKVFKVPHRSLVISQMLIIVFVLSLGILFLMVHYVAVLSSTFSSARDLSIGQRIDAFMAEHTLLRVMLTVFTASLVFVVLLRYFARGKLLLRNLLASGLLFSGLWILAGRAFGYYLRNIARFSLLYGSLATLAIIVVWIFYSACILLLCAEFTCVLQQEHLARHPPALSTVDGNRSGP